jgi:2,4'-dihydroxyacetophenone dioxygenase
LLAFSLVLVVVCNNYHYHNGKASCCEQTQHRATREGGLVKKVIDSAGLSVEPYMGEKSGDAPDGIVIAAALPDDERMWVPLGNGVFSRPLCLNTIAGYWTHLLRVRRSGMVNRHRHASPVHAWVLKGKWFYLEHDWVAEAGSYIFEPPGDTHTLIVPEDVDEMVTYFHTTGALVYVDECGETVGFEDVFTRIRTCRNHYAACGLGARYVDQFIR